MPGRSPHRNSPPPPPLISRHSPSRRRMHSPDRLHLGVGSTISRGRDHREYRSSVRRSRSPIIQHKSRSSYSPPPKRKVVPSPGREREMLRRSKLSSPERRGSAHDQYASGIHSHNILSASGSERYRIREYEKEQEVAPPLFRGPEKLLDLDQVELKRLTVKINRSLPPNSDQVSLIRNIVNPDDITIVRRPDEGKRPLFRQTTTVVASSSRDRQTSPDDYRRIISRAPERLSPEHSRERSRYTPPHPYVDSRRPNYLEKDHSPAHRPRHQTPPPEYIHPRDKLHDRRAGSREDLRRDLDVRRRRYSPDRPRSYERESDLRTRIIEKRSDPHSRNDEKEYSTKHYESEKQGRSHHSPPHRERRRAGSLDRHEGSSKPSRGEGWDRESERKRRPQSREHEERGREHYERYPEHGESSDKGRRPQSYKTEYVPPQKYYKPYEHEEFVPIPTRGRGVLPILRAVPVPMRAMLGRGMGRGVLVRGVFPMRGMPRGAPRLPFPGRGFPPRFFPPFRPHHYN